MLRARDDDVVGQALGGDPPAVVADQRDRHAAPRRRASASASITLRELPDVDSASSASPAAAVGDHLPREDRVDADVVGDRGQDRGVLGQVDRRPRRCRAVRRAEVGDDVHRVGRRAAVAEREQLAAALEARAQRRGGARSASSRLSVSVCARSAPISSRLHQHRAAHVVDHRLELVLAARPGTGTGSSRRRRRGRGARRARRAGRGARRTRARAPTARGRASRPAPGGRTGPRSAARTPTRRRPARTRSSGSRARGRARPRAPPRRRPRRRRTRSRCRRARASSASCAASSPPSPARPIAGSARLPTITGWTNSTATWRASERAAGERPNATSRPPRAKRSAIRWHRRASRSASSVEELAVGLRCAARAAPAGARPGIAGERPPRSCGRPRSRVGERAASHSRHASTPSPVRALTSIRSTSGWTWSMLYRSASRSKSRCGSRSILLTSTSSQARNISGYFSGLSSPSVTEQTITRASSPISKLGRADEVADVLDDSRSISSSGSARDRRADHVRVEVALAAEAGVGVELGDRHVQAGEAVGVQRALHVALEHARRARRAGSSTTRSSSVVLPAPGALMKLTTVTPARSKSARLARGDRVVGVERLLDDLHLGAMHAASSTSIDSTSNSLPADDRDVAAAAARAAERRDLDLPLARARHRSAAAPRPSPARAARPRRRVPRATNSK